MTGTGLVALLAVVAGVVVYLVGRRRATNGRRAILIALGTFVAINVAFAFAIVMSPMD